MTSSLLARSLSLLSDYLSPIRRSYLIIAPSLSQTLYCTVPTSPTSPFYCWEGKAVLTHPPLSTWPLMQLTHLLSFFNSNQFYKSTCGQSEIVHMSPFSSVGFYVLLITGSVKSAQVCKVCKIKYNNSVFLSMPDSRKSYFSNPKI